MISIHAPTNGATKDAVSAGALSSISIHAPTNGATGAMTASCPDSLFQSTLRRTERLHGYRCTVTTRDFNPRSDERSDYRCPPCPRSPYLFQSTLRRTERRKSAGCQIADCRFQSTLRRTERRTHSHYFQQPSHFNPRSDERSDKINCSVRCYLIISIHAPTNGATDLHIYQFRTYTFQSTLRRTERPQRKRLLVNT